MEVPTHGPLILGVTWGLTIFSGVFLGLRLYAKLTRRQGLWWDDHILFVSWFMLLAQAAVTQAGVMLGFGKPIRYIPQENLFILYLGFACISSLSSIAATLCKIAFGVTLLRLTSGYMRCIAWFCIATLSLVVVPSALGPWIQCRDSAQNNSPGACWDPNSTLRYGIFNAAWCAVIDFVLALMPWYLIWNLRLKTREKIGVGIAMSMGVLAGICAIMKGIYLVQLQAKDISYDGKDLVVWTVVEIATAIVGGSIPVLRVFFKETISSYGRSDARTATNSVPLSRMNKSQHSTITTTVRAVGKNKEGSWTVINEAEEDASSQRGILRDEEMGGAGRLTSHGDDGIRQTSTVTITVESDTIPTRKTRSFLDPN